MRGPCEVRILVVGGSGLIGAHVVDLLRRRGHGVTTVARTDNPGVDHALDVASVSEGQWRSVLAGHDGVVYAARSDEQQSLPKPIHPALHGEMVEPVVRMFAAARQEGLSRGVIMGSYYTYFDRLRPQWRLAAHHMYVRCRVEQAEQARAVAGPELPVAVLELPFVFGRAGARLPNWAPALDRWVRSRAPLVAPAGGTAAASAASVAEVAVDGLERGRGDDIPVADENLAWAQMIERIAAAAGRPRGVRRVPAAVVRGSLRIGGVAQAVRRQESGINPAYFADLMLAELFIEPVTGRSLDQAVHETFGDPRNNEG